MNETAEEIIHKAARQPERDETHQPSAEQANGHETLAVAPDIESRRQEIRTKIYIFTENGRSNRLRDHHQEWRKAMEVINRLSLDTGTDPHAIEKIGATAKDLIVAARKTHPDILEEQTIADIRTFATSSTAANLLVLEEFQRIGKEHLMAEILEK